MPIQAKLPEILIIDDNENDTKLMEEAIKSTKIAGNIHILNDAREGIDFLNKREGHENEATPDLILLDLKMPEFNGHEFLRVVKKDPYFMHIPVIILTTSSDPKDISESYKLGANCYIVKPVDFKKFKQVINVINDFWLGIAMLPPNINI